MISTACSALDDDLDCLTGKPPSDTIVCTVDQEDAPIYPCLPSSGGILIGSSCFTVAGMTLKIVCGDQTLFLYKNNASLNANPRNDVSYPFANASHSGIYECRRYDADTNGTVVVQSRSIVVNSPGKDLNLYIRACSDALHITPCTFSCSYAYAFQACHGIIKCNRNPCMAVIAHRLCIPFSSMYIYRTTAHWVAMRLSGAHHTTKRIAGLRYGEQ